MPDTGLPGKGDSGRTWQVRLRGAVPAPEPAEPAGFYSPTQDLEKCVFHFSGQILNSI